MLIFSFEALVIPLTLPRCFCNHNLSFSPGRFHDRRIHRGYPDDPLRNHYVCGKSGRVECESYADACQVPHHWCHGAGRRRARGTAPRRYPSPRLLSQGKILNTDITTSQTLLYFAQN